jgi:hypothetical protein
MNKMTRNLCAILSALVLFTTCSDEKTAKLQVWLTDAPGDYQEVNVDIQSVEINAGETADSKGWKSLNVNKGVYNLLELTNGLDTLLAEMEIPAGTISQIRLQLGNENSVKINNEIFELSTPSAQQSGLKLQVHETLAEGITYKILLDFDVARSIIETGSGKYKLKPVIRTITKAENGAVKGIVEPKESTPAIYAINGLDTLGTTFADSASGNFLLGGLPAGTYKFVFVPATGFQTTEKTNVSVQTGNVTDLGKVTVEK